jgi:uncharacterized membrane protein (DUF106 family)
MINKTINKLVMFLGIFLMFGIIMFPNMRENIGTMMDTFLKPLFGDLPIYMIIFVLAAFTGIYASLVQKYTMDWSLMKRVQEKSKLIQKEMRQAQLSNNAQKIKKLEGQYQEMMGDQMEMFKQQFKPMLYISIISIPLFYWVYLLTSQHLDATMMFPFWGQQKLSDTVFWQFQYWLIWYFMCSLPISQMTRKAMNVGGM